MYVLYFISSCLLSLYSYSLVDPNLTLINHPIWASFRSIMVQFGYFNRGSSWLVFSVLILILFFLQYKILKENILKPLRLALCIGLPLLISYPFLSHDFFNYLFDAKIITFYHQNPYLMKALDFPSDPWLQFMHWTHRTYPYGPSFLAITLIPSFLSMGKLILSFIFFKATWVLFYLASIFVTQKLDKKIALFLASSPIIIIEGLINNHNDFIAMSLFIMGIYFLNSKRRILSRLFLLLSGGIKYFTLPAILLQKKSTIINLIIMLLITTGLLYIGITRELYVWYFLNLIPFVIMFPRLIPIFSIISFGFLFSYYPYIAQGENTNPQYIVIKNSILLFTIIATCIYAVLHKKIILNQSSELELLKKQDQ